MPSNTPGKQAKNPGKTLAVIGSLLQIAPVAGAIALALDSGLWFHQFNGQIDAARAAGGSGAVADLMRNTPPRTSAWAVELASIGAITGLVGVLLLMLALFAYHYRAVWFFWVLVVVGVLSLLGNSMGILIGIVLLVFCLMRRKQFFVRQAISPA